MIHLLLLLFLVHGLTQPMEKPFGYDQELTNKLIKKRKTHEVLADNYDAYWPEIKELIEKGANPNCSLDFGSVNFSSVMTFVITYGTEQDAQFLLKYGLRIDGTNASIGSPLECAMRLKSIKWIRFFIQNGANVNEVCSYYPHSTPLMEATDYNKDIVQELLNNGADQSMTNNEGKRAIDIARERGNFEIESLLQTQKIA